MTKDILGNEIDEQDLDGFDDGESSEEPSAPAEPDYSDALRQLDVEGEVEIPLDQPRLTRKEKKQQRGRELFEDNRRSRLEAESRLADSQKQIASLEARLAAVEAVRQQGAEDDDESELNDLYTQRDRLYQAQYADVEAGRATPESNKQFEKDSRRIQNEIIQKNLDKKLKNVPQTQQSTPSDLLRIQLQTQYPGVFSNNNARLYAQGIWQTKIAAGKPNDMNTVHEAMKETARAFKMHNYESSDDDRRVLMSASRGKNAANASEGKTLKITKDGFIVRMANAAYPHLPTEEARVKHWIELNGKNYLKNQQSE